MPLTATVTYDNAVIMPAGKIEQADTIAISLKASTTFVKGAILYDSGPGTVNGVAVTSVYDAYNGSGTPSLILKRACVTDANGNITQGAQAGGMEFTQTYTSTDAFFKGLFNTADLPQSGAGGITNTIVTRGNAAQLGKIVQGNIASGLLLLG